MVSVLVRRLRETKIIWVEETEVFREIRDLLRIWIEGDQDKWSCDQRLDSRVKIHQDIIFNSLGCWKAQGFPKDMNRRLNWLISGKDIWSVRNWTARIYSNDESSWGRG